MCLIVDRLYERIWYFLKSDFKRNGNFVFYGGGLKEGILLEWFFEIGCWVKNGLEGFNSKCKKIN